MSSDAEELLRIGQLAEQTGKTTRTLHFYEELGLLHPAERTKGGFRLYSPQAVLRIDWIDRMQELGFSLSDVRGFLAQYKEEDFGPAAMAHLRDYYVGKLRETRETIERLRALENELQESLDYLLTCESCAPTTPRSACPNCDEHHPGCSEPPTMIAAVSEQARVS